MTIYKRWETTWSDLWLNVGLLSEDEPCRPLVSVDAEQSLQTAILLLRQHQVHRLLVMDTVTGNPLYVLTHKRILRFLQHAVSIMILCHRWREYNDAGVCSVTAMLYHEPFLINCTGWMLYFTAILERILTVYHINRHMTVTRLTSVVSLPWQRA